SRHVLHSSPTRRSSDRHPDVRKISFTGSTTTGRKIMRSAADTLKRLTLELGGNDAGVVLDDVDPKAVAPKLFQSAFTHAGQVCRSVEHTSELQSLGKLV